MTCGVILDCSTKNRISTNKIFYKIEFKNYNKVVYNIHIENAKKKYLKKNRLYKLD